MMFNDGRRMPVPAQFSLRVAVLGTFGLVVFALIFFRLWYLQVLSGDRYLAQAQNNQVREFTVQAPRGEIVDRDGEVLVDNRTALALQLRTTELPKRRARRDELFQQLGKVAGMSADKIRRQIRIQTKESPASPVTLKRDVPYELVYFIRENEARFPGVSVDRVYVRRYPHGTLAAHVLGYVREVAPEELKDPRFDSLEPGDMVGKEGVERTYDSLVRGVNGATRIAVDASGRPTGRPLSVEEPQPGNDLRLTLDAGVQAEAERALASLGKPGAFVAMEVDDGSILALGSNPAYDPSMLAKPVITPAVADQIFGSAGDPLGTGAPIFNRAVAGAYPTGSTFKPITSVAALDAGAITTTEAVSDGGSVTIGDIRFQNAGGVAHGSVAMKTALQVSSDVYYYLLGAELNGSEGQPLQDWAKQLGLGGLTGIDIPGEDAGLVPTPEWRNELYKDGLTDRPWSVGDNVNLSVGQGDLQADPLQMAVAYATIGNGGTVVRPHVAMRVEGADGGVKQEIAPAPRRELDIEEGWQRTIMEGLHAAAMEPGGTSYGIFAGFPKQIAGKTGTAERPPAGDQSWYVALAPYPDPKVVVAVTVEQGGFGADSAAPVTRQILEEYFDFSPKQRAKAEEAAATASSSNLE